MAGDKLEILNLGPKLKFIGEFIPHLYSFSIGIFFSLGSRDENRGKEGKTHFLEHMLFKGTRKRSAQELFKKIESLGGTFDAYTTKENTILVTRFLKEYQDDVVDIILEMMNEATLPEDEFEKEKAVILEEIKSSREDPEDRVFDLLFEVAFKPHPIANPIVGFSESVISLTRDEILGHFQSFISQPITVAVAGNYHQDSLIDKIGRIRGNDLERVSRIKPTFNAKKVAIEGRRDISQVYVALGTLSFPFPDERRYPINVISSALGGGMSSRLFLRLREREGLVYNIQTFNELFSDIGLMGIFFIADQKNLYRCLEVIKEELLKLKGSGFTDEEIQIHRSLIKGNFLIGLENTSNRMLRLGRSLSQLGKVPEIAEVIEKIDGVDHESISELLPKLCSPDRYTIAVVGEAEEDEVRGFFER
ncbi:hypothetical protein DRP53_04320 [candidate division WOR-3 bacterium]|uniref:Insulinase family protein n=1 Tax=candidate division WOR-3 bacterium TaxID=2052148 RepID=A0A660SIQ8_UNCW3|nr:MAG: hypothetical protein DRP53_04320 [candidate division WOR-3 bacterium]